MRQRSLEFLIVGLTYQKKYKSIWLSDIHLGSKGCQAERLLDFLYNNSCEELYLVGDIVDGWRMEQSLFWPQAHTNVLRRFLSYAKDDTNVNYITGNHDEFLRSYSPILLGNVKVTDRAIYTSISGKKYLVIHGDQFDLVTKYSKWISKLGSWAYELLMATNRVVNFFRKNFNLGYWSFSAYVKHKVKSAVNFISDFESTLAFVCKKEGFDGVICGHIHSVANEMIDEIHYLNCGDWVESCTALVEDYEGRFHIIDYSKYTNNQNYTEDKVA